MKNNFIYQIIKKDIKDGKYNFIKTRFAPEPNGFLHIGHAKSIWLNFGIAEYFNGTCNLRFDDTNPLEEQKQYVNAIIKDIKWLGYHIEDKNIHFASDYYDIFYEYAKELIIKGLAYVDELTKDKIKLLRGTLKVGGIDSPYRRRSIKDNLFCLEKMKNAEYKEGTACLRAKINMKDPCILYRDPILYRIKYISHYRTLDRWCIYPTYDFAHCISDAIEQITHSLCTLEFVNNKRLYEWILNNINIGHIPKQYEFSRLNLEYNLMSKRKIKLLIDKKIVDNWDDPRMITISGLKNRGYFSETIKEFCSKVGITRQENMIELSFLENLLKKRLDHICTRFFAILDPIKVIILNLSKDYYRFIKVPNHPKRPDMGKRKILLTNQLYIDKIDYFYKIKKFAIPSNRSTSFIFNKKIIIRLRYANCFLQILELICEQNNIDNPKLIIGIIVEKTNFLPNKQNIIHWVSLNFVKKSYFLLYNRLFNVMNPEKIVDFENHINPDSIIIKQGFVEKNIKVFYSTENDLTEVFQFERIGYFRNDYNIPKKEIERSIIKFIQIIPLKKIK